jgi:hypothetical protein
MKEIRNALILFAVVILILIFVSYEFPDNHGRIPSVDTRLKIWAAVYQVVFFVVTMVISAFIMQLNKSEIKFIGFIVLFTISTVVLFIAYPYTPYLTTFAGGEFVYERKMILIQFSMAASILFGITHHHLIRAKSIKSVNEIIAIIKNYKAVVRYLRGR